jgi:hypothetical protein
LPAQDLCGTSARGGHATFDSLFASSEEKQWTINGNKILFLKDFLYRNNRRWTKKQSSDDGMAHQKSPDFS